MEQILAVRVSTCKRGGDRGRERGGEEGGGDGEEERKVKRGKNAASVCFCVYRHV